MMWHLVYYTDSPGVNKVENAEFVRQSGRQSVCVRDDVVVQEAGVGVEEFHLSHGRLSDSWVAVAHWWEEEGEGQGRPYTIRG